MKNFQWFSVLSRIIIVLVYCEKVLSQSDFSSPFPYYENVQQQQFQYSGLAGQQSFFSPSQFNTGYYQSQQFGVPLPYQNHLSYQGASDYQYQASPLQYHQQLSYSQHVPAQQYNAFGDVGFGGYQALGPAPPRSARLQHLYTRSGPSRQYGNAGLKQSTFTPSQADPLRVPVGTPSVPVTSSTIALSLPTPSFLQTTQTQPQKLLTPTGTSYFPPTPTTGSVTPALSSTIASVPSFAPVPSAPPLPPVPSLLPQFTKAKTAKQLVYKNTDYTFSSSIPFAEGHSIGSEIAYSFAPNFNTPLTQSQNLGYNTLLPNTPIKTLEVVKDTLPNTNNVNLLKITDTKYLTPDALYSRYGSSPINFVNIVKGDAAQQLLASQALKQPVTYNYPTPSFLGSVHTGPGFNGDYNAQFSHSNYGDDFTKLFSNVYKRESRTKLRPLTPKPQSKHVKKSF